MFMFPGVPTLWGNFELKNVNLAQKMLLQFSGKAASELKDRGKWDGLVEKFSQLPLYWMKFHGSTRYQCLHQKWTIFHPVAFLLMIRLGVQFLQCG